MAPKFLDNFLAPFRAQRVSPSTPLGVTSTPGIGGFIATKEKNPKLQPGEQRALTYQETVYNTIIVAASIRYFLGLLSTIKWRAKPPPHLEGADLAKSQELCEFMESVLDDMETPLHRITRRQACFKFYGSATQVWTSKKREQDGKIGLADVELRMQNTIFRWDLDRTGTVHGVVQLAPDTSEEIYIPRNRLVYSVDADLDDSPEGTGLLRHAMDSAERLKVWKELQVVGWQNDLRGAPIGFAPFFELKEAVRLNLIKEADAKEALGYLKDFIENHRVSAARGMILDSSVYKASDTAATPSAQKKWGLEIARADSSSVEHMTEVIEAEERALARLMGTEFLMLGAGDRGSNAQHKDKTSSFYVLASGVSQDVACDFTRDLVRPVMLLNKEKDRRLWPRLHPSAIQMRDVEDIAATLERMAKAGATLQFDDPVIDEVRDLMEMSHQPEVRLQVMEEQAQLGPDGKPKLGPDGKPLPPKTKPGGDLGPKPVTLVRKPEPGAGNGDEPDVEETEAEDTEKRLRKAYERVAALAKSGGCMVAFFLPKEAAQVVSLTGGADATSLHCTVAYLGKDVDADQVRRAVVATRRIASRWAPLRAQITGPGRFTTRDNRDVVYASVDAPALGDLRHALVRELTAMDLDVSRDHGYVPHVTLAYIEAEHTSHDGNYTYVTAMPVERIPPTDCVLGELVVASGLERVVIPLTGEER